MRNLAPTAVVGVLTAVMAVPTASAGAASQRPVVYCANRDAYEVTDCARPPGLPAAPFARQLDWVLDQLAGDAATVTVADVREHFSADLLALPGMSAEDIVGALKNTLAEFGPMRFGGSPTRPAGTRRSPSSRPGPGSVRRSRSA